MSPMTLGSNDLMRPVDLPWNGDISCYYAREAHERNCIWIQNGETRGEPYMMRQLVYPPKL